jgi:hypothetical protein
MVRYVVMRRMDRRRIRWRMGVDLGVFGCIVWDYSFAGFMETDMSR